MKSNEDNADKQKRDVRLAMLFSVTALVASTVVVWLIRMRILPAAYLFTAQVGMLAVVFQWLTREPLGDLISRRPLNPRTGAWALIGATAFTLITVCLALVEYLRSPQTWDMLIAILWLIVGGWAWYHGLRRIDETDRQLSNRGRWWLYGLLALPVACLATIGAGLVLGQLKVGIPPNFDFGVLAYVVAFEFFFSTQVQLVGEELAFRGFIFRRLLRRNFWLALFFSSMWFGVWHWPLSLLILTGQPLEVKLSGMLMALVLSTFIGIIMALAYLRTGNLIVVGVGHGLADVTRSILFGVGSGAALVGVLTWTTAIVVPLWVVFLGLIAAIGIWMLCREVKRSPEGWRGV